MWWVIGIGLFHGLLLGLLDSQKDVKSERSRA